MNRRFDKAAVQRQLPGVVFISHGGLALGMLDTVTLIMGKQHNLAAFTLDENDDPILFREAFMEAVEAFCAGVVIFVDMFGGSPCNQLLLASGTIRTDFCAVSGMNLPLVLETIAMRRICRGKELYDAILAAAPASIVHLNKVIEELAADN